MSEERNLQPTLMSGAKTEENKVVCRYCGANMIPTVDKTATHMISWCECEKCHSKAPEVLIPRRAHGIVTYQESCEAAYLAATRTPPNLPLTKAQVEAMDGIDAIWLVGMKSGARFVCAASECLDYEGDWYLCFARKPTHADIAAALEAGKGEGNG